MGGHSIKFTDEREYPADSDVHMSDKRLSVAMGHVSACCYACGRVALHTRQYHIGAASLLYS